MNVFDQNAAQYAESYLLKGDKVYVEGRVQTRKWQDQDGADRYSTEIVVNAIGGQLRGLTVTEASTFPEKDVTAGSVNPSPEKDATAGSINPFEDPPF